MKTDSLQIIEAYRDILYFNYENIYFLFQPPLFSATLALLVLNCIRHICKLKPQTEDLDSLLIMYIVINITSC
jgi:hypothetical protein